GCGQGGRRAEAVRLVGQAKGREALPAQAAGGPGALVPTRAQGALQRWSATLFRPQRDRRAERRRRAVHVRLLVVDRGDLLAGVRVLPGGQVQADAALQARGRVVVARPGHLAAADALGVLVEPPVAHVLAVDHGDRL